MLLETFKQAGLSIQTYLIGSEGVAAVIDPTRNIAPILECLEKRDLQLAYIFETHIHADFLSGARQLAQATQARIIVSGVGLNDAPIVYGYENAHTARGNATYDVGQTTLVAIHTPGHTPEHMSYLLFDKIHPEAPLILFSGDFLFVNSFGRPDLMGVGLRAKLAEALYATIYSERLKKMPDGLMILPTHGAGSACGKEIADIPFTTMGRERQFNPIFNFEGRLDDFTKYVLSNQPPIPTYFSELKKRNLQGAALMAANNISEIPLLSLTDFSSAIWPSQASKSIAAGVQVVDIRQPPAFAAGHIPGSYSVWYSNNLATWAGYVLNYQDPIYLVGDNQTELENAALQLRLIGLDHIKGCLQGGFNSWQAAKLPVASLKTVDVHMLKAALSQKDSQGLVVLDVRSPVEYSSAHISGAVPLELSQLSAHMAELDQSKEYAVICGGGFRASLAASLLLKNGFPRVQNVAGGMRAWLEAFPR